MKLFRNSLLREWRRYRRIRILPIASVAIPVVITVLYVLMFTRGTVHNLPIAVYDGDQTTMSRQLVRMVGATPTMRVALHTESTEEGRQAMMQGECEALLIIPKGLQSDVMGGGQAQVAAEINGSKILTSGLLRRDMTTVLQAFNIGVETQLLGAKGIPAAKGYQMAYPIAFQKHILFNPYGSYAYYLLPALLPLLLAIMVIVTTVYALGTELRFGTAGEWLETAGGSITRALLTKLLPYAVIFSLVSLFMNTLLYRFMGVPFQAEGVMITVLGNLFLILSYMSLGVILIALSANMRFSLSIGGGYATASLSFCGLTFPYLGMYPFMAAIGHLFPFSYYMRLFVDQSMRGAPPAQSLFDLGMMGLFILASVPLLPRLKKISLDPAYYGKL